MKQLFIAGNWKSTKGVGEADEWITAFHAKYQTLHTKWKETRIILCAPFTLLHFLKWRIDSLKLPIELGAQDVSPFDSGAYTGEINSQQLAELVRWVIIGHTERRRYFGETDEVLAKKVEQCLARGLQVIYCVGDETLPVPMGVAVISYEPNWAIGTGHADTPHHANRVIEMIKKKSGVKTVIYGGSVTSDNVASFVSESAIDGILPGGASFDPEAFCNLISQATS